MMSLICLWRGNKLHGNGIAHVQIHPELFGAGEGMSEDAAMIKLHDAQKEPSMDADQK